MKNEIFAVLTGDLVGSRRQPRAKVDAAIEVLEDASKNFGMLLGLELRFTRYRGDGWQVIITQPATAFRAMVYLRAKLIAAKLDVDTRISCGIGQIESAGTSDLSDATGEAFYISGDHLETARKRRFVMGGKSIGVWQNAVLLLADQLVSDWSSAQAEAAAIDILEATTQDEIASRLGITRQAVQLRLAGSGIASLSEAFEAFKSYDYRRDSPND